MPTSFLKNSRNQYGPRTLAVFISFDANKTSLGRGLDAHTRHAPSDRYSYRGETVRGDHIKGKSTRDSFSIGGKEKKFTDAGQITYDLDQLPADAVLQLRDSILSQLVAFASGPRPIQTQLCVCLASLAIQMTTWKDVLGTVGSTLGGSAGDCVLEFLKILPEEVTEGRKINLSVCSNDQPSSFSTCAFAASASPCVSARKLKV